MHMKNSYWVVLGILGVIGLYFLVRSLFGGGEGEHEAKGKAGAGREAPSVQIASVPEQVRNYEVVLRGRTESARAVVFEHDEEDDDDDMGGDSLGGDLKDHERRLILTALEEGHGSRKFAAEKLGISPRTLRYKLARLRDAGVAVPGV